MDNVTGERSINDAIAISDRRNAAHKHRKAATDKVVNGTHFYEPPSNRARLRESVPARNAVRR